MRRIHFPALPSKLVAAAGFSVLAATQVTAGSLTGDELQQTMIGHTWAWRSEKFALSGVTTYFQDGRITMAVDGVKGLTGGRWRIDSDRLCVTLTGNTESCLDKLNQLDENTLFSESSRTTFVLRD